MELICRIGIFMIAAQAVIHFAPSDKYAKYMRLVVGIIILLQFLSPVYNILSADAADWDAQLSDIEADLNGLIYGKAYSGSVSGAAGVNESIIHSMEKEVKSKLNNALEGEMYSVIKVEIDIGAGDGNEAGYGTGSSDYGKNADIYYDMGNDINNSSYGKYRLNKLRVAVRAYMSDEETGMDNGSAVERAGTEDGSGAAQNNTRVKIGKVSVKKIAPEGDGDDVTYEDAGNSVSSSGVSAEKQSESERLKKKFCDVLGLEEKYVEVNIYGAVE